jgi:cell division protease FtsH
MIDEEIRSVIDRNYYRAEKILQENMAILHLMADALMKWETIDRMQIDDLMAGKEARPPMEYGLVKVLKTPESSSNETDNSRSLQPDQSFA